MLRAVGSISPIPRFAAAIGRARTYRARGVLLAIVLAAAAASLASPASAAPACPISYGTQDDAKPNKLYVYMPTTADSTFPEFGAGFNTSPLAAFDVANLTSYTGTAAALRNAVTDVVADDYCEFNVQVRQTTTAPPTTFVRRNVIGVGTDSANQYGFAENVDIGDPTNADSARVWAGTYQATDGGFGGALNGANSTLTRWARAIGGTVAHEAGHNYGLAHTDDTSSLPGEDVRTRHVMPAGTGLTGEHRAGYRRHFSDRTFSILAANAGLSIQTMHNWDLTNPNAQTANGLRMQFLSTQASVLLSWSYTGPSSPWTNPTVSSSLGTTTFRGTTYHRYNITWSTGQNWNGGSAGQVLGGRAFHIGATFSGINFNQPDAIVIQRIQLLDAAGTALGLQPRLVGYDSGALDAADGTFDLSLFNVGSPAPLIIRNVVVQQLPRVLSLDAMMRGNQQLVDWTGEPFAAWPETTRVALKQSKPLKRGQAVSLLLARMSQPRHVLERFNGRDCDRADNTTGLPDTAGCGAGISTDLFPSTTLYVTAEVVQPKAKTWDRRLRRYVVRDVVSRIFFQVGGRTPDLNDNGTDDAIDIATRRSRDRNRDGVPDEAQRPLDRPH